MGVGEPAAQFQTAGVLGLQIDFQRQRAKHPEVHMGAAVDVVRTRRGLATAQTAAGVSFGGCDGDLDRRGKAAGIVCHILVPGLGGRELTGLVPTVSGPPSGGVAGSRRREHQWIQRVFRPSGAWTRGQWCCCRAARPPRFPGPCRRRGVQAGETTPCIAGRQAPTP